MLTFDERPSRRSSKGQTRVIFQRDHLFTRTKLLPRDRVVENLRYDVSHNLLNVLTNLYIYIYILRQRVNYINKK